jgi:CHAD domain-containing protein
MTGMLPAETEAATGSTRPPLLSRPPEEGARLLALGFLDQAAEARPRLTDPEDVEALHDFRVALRRLRSCLRAYDGYLEESVPGKLARRLKRLVQATGAGRDAEVQIEWLRDKAKLLGSYHRTGYTWLLAALEERKRKGYEEVHEQVASEFDGLEEALRKRLSVYRAEVHLDREAPRHTLGEAAAGILEQHVEELGDHLAQVHGAEDEEEAHEARIAAKRLRYLLEPLAGELPSGKAVIKRLKGLQELLGELHDAHVLEQELAAAVERAGAERAQALLDLSLAAAPDEKRLRAERRRARESGLIALARLNRARRDRLFQGLTDGWTEGRAGPFLEEARALAGELRQPSST